MKRVTCLFLMRFAFNTIRISNILSDNLCVFIIAHENNLSTEVEDGILYKNFFIKGYPSKTLKFHCKNRPNDLKIIDQWLQITESDRDY